MCSHMEARGWHPVSASSPPSHPFVCLNQGLSLNPEPTKLKTLARLADGECTEFLCPHSPVMGSQACTAKASFCTWMLGIHVQFLILGQHLTH